MVAIFHFSSESKPMPELTEHVWDKLLHFVEYAGLGALLYRAFQGEGLGWAAAFAAATFASVAYGASDEWHQSFVPLRDSSALDWLTDMIGGAAGAALYGTLSRPRGVTSPPGAESSKV
jgi:VanZ family protein